MFNCHVTCSQVYDAVNQEGMKADLKKSLANRSQNITNITLRWKCISNSQRAAARPWQHTCFEVVDSYCQLNKNPVSVELTVCVLAKGKNTQIIIPMRLSIYKQTTGIKVNKNIKKKFYMKFKIFKFYSFIHSLYLLIIKCYN